MTPPLATCPTTPSLTDSHPLLAPAHGLSIGYWLIASFVNTGSLMKRQLILGFSIVLSASLGGCFLRPPVRPLDLRRVEEIRKRTELIKEFINEINSQGVEARLNIERHLKKAAIENLGEGKEVKFRHFFERYFQIIKRDQFETAEEFYRRWQKAPPTVFYSTETLRADGKYNIDTEEFYFDYFLTAPKRGYSTKMHGPGTERMARNWNFRDKVYWRGDLPGILVERTSDTTLETGENAFGVTAAYSMERAVNYGVLFPNIDVFCSLNEKENSLPVAEGARRTFSLTAPGVPDSSVGSFMDSAWIDGRLASNAEAYEDHCELRLKIPRVEARRSRLMATFGFRIKPDWIRTKYHHSKAPKLTSKKAWDLTYYYADADLISLVIYDDITKKVYANCVYYTPKDIAEISEDEPSGSDGKDRE